MPPMVLARLKSKPREWANQEQQEPTPETGALLFLHRNSAKYVWAFHTLSHKPRPRAWRHAKA